MTSDQQAELEQVVRALVDTFMIDTQDSQYTVIEGTDSDMLTSRIVALLAAQRAKILKEVLASFEKHHDECNDFRHCECASGFWYEWVGKSWMDAKQSEERS